MHTPRPLEAGIAPQELNKYNPIIKFYYRENLNPDEADVVLAGPPCQRSRCSVASGDASVVQKIVMRTKVHHLSASGTRVGGGRYAHARRPDHIPLLVGARRVWAQRRSTASAQSHAHPSRPSRER